MLSAQKANKAQLYRQSKHCSDKKYSVCYYIKLPAEFGFQIETPCYQAVKKISNHPKGESRHNIYDMEAGENEVDARQSKEHS